MSWLISLPCTRAEAEALSGEIPELDALTMAYDAIERGAAGVDMGRNIFQSDAPVAMIQAVRAVVHDHETPKNAFELYKSLKKKK